MSDTDKEKINALLREAASIIRSKADSEIPALLGDGILRDFLEAMAPRKSDTVQTIYGYLLAGKCRLQLVALFGTLSNNTTA